MAPPGDFPTFKSRDAYMITEGVEPFAIFLLVLALLVIAAAVIAVICCTYHCICRCVLCKKCKEFFNNQRRPYSTLPDPSDTRRNETGLQPQATTTNETVLALVESSEPVGGCERVLCLVFPVIEAAKVKNKEVLLFSKRRLPQEIDNQKLRKCQHFVVYAYFITLLFLLCCLFLLLFCNFLLYRKTSTCNDINVKTEYSICFDINHGYKRVNCVAKQEDPNLEVICYLTNFDFFRALGVAFSAIRAIIALISAIFPLYISIGQKLSCVVLVAFQVVVAVIIFVAFIVCYSMYWAHHPKDIFHFLLYGDPPLVHATVWLAIIIAVLIVLIPWWPFKDSSVFEQEIQSVTKQEVLQDELRQEIYLAMTNSNRDPFSQPRTRERSGNENETRV